MKVRYGERDASRYRSISFHYPATRRQSKAAELSDAQIGSYHGAHFVVRNECDHDPANGVFVLRMIQPVLPSKSSAPSTEKCRSCATSSGRSTRCRSENRHAQKATIPSTAAPPSTTEPIGPNQAAVTPDSNVPSCPAQLTNSVLTAKTRPRMPSGVANWINDWRITVLSMSAAPIKHSSAIASPQWLDNPNAMVALPYTATAPSMIRPLARVTDRCARTAATITAPAAGAPRRAPNPHELMSKISRAKMGKRAVTPPNSVAARSSDIAPRRTGRAQTN